jgi:hypothetical protein
MDLAPAEFHDAPYLSVPSAETSLRKRRQSLTRLDLRVRWALGVLAMLALVLQPLQARALVVHEHGDHVHSHQMPVAQAAFLGHSEEHHAEHHAEHGFDLDEDHGGHDYASPHDQMHTPCEQSVVVILVLEPVFGSKGSATKAKTCTPTLSAVGAPMRDVATVTPSTVLAATMPTAPISSRRLQSLLVASHALRF